MLVQKQFCNASVQTGRSPTSIITYLLVCTSKNYKTELLMNQYSIFTSQEPSFDLDTAESCNFSHDMPILLSSLRTT